MVGVFGWTGKPIDGIFLAAILTIIGYTVNDSVVVFDRIRETRNARSTDNLGSIIDTAIVKLPRTINTGISTLFILSALLSWAATRWRTSPSRCSSASWSAPTRRT